METNYHLYYEALETNKEAFAHRLFTKAHKSLSTALHYAFYLRNPRRVAKVEVLAQEQLKKLEQYFAPLPLLLEPAEVSNYRTLVESAGTCRTLLESVSRAIALDHLQPAFQPEKGASS